MQATAIIGAVFGDEGKGRMVDAFSQKEDTIVVRYNGGAQAGHTVVRDGVRHVFKHFGAGSLNGADTYLSKHFLVNPMVWQDEQAELLKLGLKPNLYINPGARVTTPYDMLINQELERHRGRARHGSCGYGIHETIVRSGEYPFDAYELSGEYPFAAYELGGNSDGSREKLREKLRRLRAEWVPDRLKELGITTFTDEFLSLIDNPRIIDYYLWCCSDLGRRSALKSDASLKYWDNVVFEGAQGLLLDEDNTDFAPHLTHSKCGLSNISEICNNAEIDSLRAIYVARAYATRHGAGPFPTEDPTLQYDDPTNHPNQYQGKLRFGAINLGLLKEAVQTDLQKAPGIEVTHDLAITCLDQIPDEVPYVYDGEQHTVCTCILPGLAAREIGAKHIHMSSSSAGRIVCRHAAQKDLVAEER